jgi:TP901 family phage tail tape measure protein
MSLQDIQIKIILGVQNMGAVAQVNKALGGTYQAADRLEAQTKKLSSTNLKGVKTWGDVLMRIDQAQAQYDALYRAAYRVTQVGQEINRVGRAGLGILADSASAWGDYEFSLNRAAGALLENRDLYPQLSKSILAVARDVRLYKPEEVAKATYYWASTTGQQVRTLKDLQTAMSGVTPILKAAALTETDFEAAIKGVYSILKQYNLPLSDTTDITEKLMLITQRTALEFPDLINSFKMLGPVARANGQSFEDIAQLLGMIGDAGIRGSMSGRALRQFFIQLVRPSDRAKDALNDVFEATFKMDNAYKKLVFPKGKFVGAAQYIKYLADVTKDMTQADRNSFLAKIATANELPVLTALLQREMDVRKGLVKATDAQKYSLEGAHQAFETSFGYLATSWKGLVGLLENSFMPIILQIGRSVTQMVAPVVEGLADIAVGISDWLEKNPQIRDFMVQLLAVGSAILVVVGSALVFFGSLAALYAVVKLVGAAMIRMIGPLVVVGALIAGVAAAVITNSGGIRDALSHLFDVIKEIFGQASAEGKTFSMSWQTILKFIGDSVAGAVKALADGINWVADALERINANPGGHKVLMAVVQVLTTYVGIAAAVKTASLGLGLVSQTILGFGLLVRPLTSFLAVFTGIPAMLGMVGGAFRAFAGVVTGALTLIAAHPVIALIIGIAALLFAAWQTNFLGIRDIVASIANWFVNVAAPAIAGFIQGIIDFVGELADNFKRGWDTVVGIVGPAVDTIIGFLTRLAQPFIDLVQKHWPAIVAGVQSLVDTVTGVFGHLAEVFMGVLNNQIIPTVQMIVRTLVDSFNSIAAAVGPVIQSIIGFIQALVDFAMPIIQALVDFITTVFMPVWDVLDNVIGGALGIIGGLLKTAFEFFMTSIFQPFAEFAINLFGTLFETIGAIVDGALKIITGIIEGALAIIKGIFDFFTALLKGDWGAAWDAVKGIVTGVFDALKKIVGGALEAIVGVIKGGLKIVLDLFVAIGQSIISVLRGILDTIFGIGKAIVTFLWDGAKSVVGWLIDHVKGFINNVVSFFQTAPGKVLDAGKDIISDLWNGITSGITGFFNNVRNFISTVVSVFTGLPGKMLDIGKNVIGGIWDGIKSMAGWIADKIHDLVISIIPGPIRDALGIHSPSRVTAALGVQIMMGLAQGITGTDAALIAMQQQSQAIVAAAKAGMAESSAALTSNLEASMPSQSNAYTFETTARRDLYLHVDVTSSDGSVDAVKTEELANLIKGPALVDSLEHMASVS